ncbi:hypothetical protein JG688_00016657, partial [Phytophthora aleatoria]
MDGQQRDRHFAVWIPAIATFLLLVVLIDKRTVTTFGGEDAVVKYFRSKEGVDTEEMNGGDSTSTSVR